MEIYIAHNHVYNEEKYYSSKPTDERLQKDFGDTYEKDYIQVIKAQVNE